MFELIVHVVVNIAVTYTVIMFVLKNRGIID